MVIHLSANTKQTETMTLLSCCAIIDNYHNSEESIQFKVAFYYFYDILFLCILHNFDIDNIYVNATWFFVVVDFFFF